MECTEDCALYLINFVEELKQEDDWYTLGIYLNVPQYELNEIEAAGSNLTRQRRLAKLFEAYQHHSKPSWDHVISSLKRLEHNSLADKLHDKFCKQHVSEQHHSRHNADEPSAPVLTVEVDQTIGRRLEKFHLKFVFLLDNIRKELNNKPVLVDDFLFFVRLQCNVQMPHQLEINEAFEIFCSNNVCFIQYYLLEDLVDYFSLNVDFTNYKKDLEEFMQNSSIETLMSKIETKPQKCTVELKLKGFWYHVTIKRFERLVKCLFKKPNSHLGKMLVNEGCISVKWILFNDVRQEDLFRRQAFFIMKAIGVISVSSFDLNKSFDCNEASFDELLMSAIKRKEASAVEMILAIENFSKEHLHNTSSNLLSKVFSYACQRGHADVVSLLLKVGVNPNVMSRSRGETPLMTASRLGHQEVVETLLKDSPFIEIDVPTADGETALHMACQRGNSDIVSALLRSGANSDIAQNVGLTPLMIACTSKHLDAVKVLLNSFVDVDTQIPTLRKTAFNLVCERGYSDIASLLLQYHASSNLCDKFGMTPLMEASRKGHDNIIDLLWLQGVDMNEAGPRGDTALHWASLKNHKNVVKVLLSLGADPSAKNNSNQTPVDCAKDEIKELLMNHIEEHRDTMPQMIRFTGKSFNRQGNLSLPDIMRTAKEQSFKSSGNSMKSLKMSRISTFGSANKSNLSSLEEQIVAATRKLSFAASSATSFGLRRRAHSDDTLSTGSSSNYSLTR